MELPDAAKPAPKPDMWRTKSNGFRLNGRVGGGWYGYELKEPRISGHGDYDMVW